MVILVTGFGPFRDVVDNPSARAARGVDGRRIAGETVLGVELPVSYARATAIIARYIAAHGRPRLLLSLGVATGRPKVEVETRAKRIEGPLPADIDGDRPIWEGPDVVPTRVNATVLAKALGGSTSGDAGDYVCNGVFYRALIDYPDLPVGFVHLPADGIAVDRLLRGLAALVEPV